MKKESIENNQIEKILKNQENLIGKKWAESRKKAFEEVKKMEQRQNTLTNEQVRNEAFEQADRIKKERRTNG